MELIEIPSGNLSAFEKLLPASQEWRIWDNFSSGFTRFFPFREGQANHALIERQVKWSFSDEI
jgi:hypothetical protein